MKKLGTKLCAAFLVIFMLSQYISIANILATETVHAFSDNKVAGDATDGANYISKHEIKIEGYSYSGRKLDSSKPFEVDLEFQFTWDQISEAGKDFYYVLPEHISIGNVASKESPNILMNDANERIGTYYYDNNIIYFSFDNNSSRQLAYFNLEASWNNVEGLAEISLKWNDAEQIIRFDHAGINISKTQGDITLLDNGRMVKKFEITIWPKIEEENANPTIKGIELHDLFYGPIYNIAEGVYEEQPTKYLQVRNYDKEDNLVKTDWYDSKEVPIIPVQNIDGKYEFTIKNLEIVNGGKIVVEYYIEMKSDKIIEADAGSTSSHYNNEAIATHTTIHESTGTTQTFDVSTKISGSYTPTAKWIYKKAGTPDVYVQEGEEKRIVPYTITVNKNRKYSLGGSILGDELSGFVGGKVEYATNEQPYIEIYKGWGNIKTGEDATIEYLDWIILPYNDYKKLEELKSQSDDLAIDVLFYSEQSELRQTLLKAINEKKGNSYKEITKELASKFIFTFNPDDTQEANPNFVWFIPIDTQDNTGAYYFHYKTLTEKAVGTFKNSAKMWYKRLVSAGEPGKPIFFDDALSAEKHNEGVYKDVDGNFCVDWTISIELPEGSGGFEQIGIWDYKQTYSNVPIGDSGNRYIVQDWIKGLDNYSVYDFYHSDDRNEYSRKISDKIIKVSSDSKDPRVQEVVDRISMSAITASHGHSYSGDRVNSSKWGNFLPPVIIDAYGGSGARFSAGSEAVGAGQIIVDEPWGSVESGDTISVGQMFFYIGDLPATEEGYKIDIKYTTIVNPELVKALPKILEETGEDSIKLTNNAKVQLARGQYEFYPESHVIGDLYSSYWIGSTDILPAIEKEGIYDEKNTKINYKISLNTGKQVKGENKTYVVDDELTLSGLKYSNNTFVLYDDNGKVAYSTDSSKTVDNEYKNLVKLTINNSDNENSKFKLELDNSTGKFTNSEGLLKLMELKYSVNTNGVRPNILIQNNASLKSISTDGETGETNVSTIGRVSSETLIEGPINKKMTNTPSLENQYKAEFDLNVNLQSYYADDYMKKLKTGDIFTIKDTFEESLLLDIDSIKLYGYNEDTEKYEIINNGYKLKYDDRTKVLLSEITVKEGISKYLIKYGASVVGRPGRFAKVRNKAEVENSTVEPIEYEIKIFKYSFGAGAITDDRKITLVKYNYDNIEDRLAGAEFELYELNENSWENLTTTENGVEVLRTTDTGKFEISNKLSQVRQFIKNDTWYKIEEVKAPNDYVLLNKPIYYYVTNENGDYPENVPEGIDEYRVIDLEDNIIGVQNNKLKLEIIKTDSFNGDLISGAEFKLYSDSNCQNEVAISKETEETGKYLIENIAIGDGNVTLYLKETKAPSEYQLDKRVYKIVLKAEKIDKVVSIDNNNNLEFSNEQEISSINFKNDSNTSKLRIEKNVISGIEAAKNLDFEFTIELRDSENNVLTESYPTLKTKKDGTTEKGTIQSGNILTIKDSENILINDLPDGAKYTITESENANYKTCYSINDSKNENNVPKTDGRIATGVVNMGGVETVTFENKQYIETKIQIYKELNTGNLSNLPEFEFELKQENKRLQTVKADKTSGLAEFSIELDKTGTYEYEIKEIIPENKLEYVEYSTQTIHVTVIVSNDENGNMIANINYVGGTGTNKNVITNKYTATGKFNIQATKSIEGYETGHNLENNLFEFEIYENNKLIATASNDANGNIKFPGIIYELSEAKSDIGKHTYKIIEKDGKLPGYTYDKTEYTVELDVEDQGDGNLVINNVTNANLGADNKYQLNKDATKAANFVNTYDAKGTLEIEANKIVTDLDKGYSIKNLSGNEFEFILYEKEGNGKLTEVHRAKNNANGKVTMPEIEYRMANLGQHTYVLKENTDVKMPGVVNSSEEVNIEVNVTNNGDGTLQVEKTYKKDNKTIQNIVFTNTITKTKFAKTDITTGKSVTGAKMEIRNASNQVVETWTTTNEEHYVYGLPVGNYTLIETQAPTEQGYVHVENVKFKVLETGKIKTVEMKDDYTKVQIKKTDITTGKDVIGATLQILDENGEVVEAYNAEGTEKVKLEWITEQAVDKDGKLVVDEEGNPVAKIVTFTKLPVGKYTLVENQAPTEDGYVKAEGIEFEIIETDEIQLVGMEDDYTKVIIEKVDENGDFVEGAKLIVKDLNGNIIVSWETNKEPYEIIKKLVPGRKYILEELDAPNDYEKAENIEFIVSEDGKEDIIRMVDKKKVNMPKTGQAFILYYLVIAIIGILGIIILFVKRKNEKEEKRK
ncbi:MAG: hypothetical protein J6D03_08245 [Clostridia bacterium]|nr:hypothetical protein [Clostridia bacterium]